MSKTWFGVVLAATLVIVMVSMMMSMNEAKAGTWTCTVSGAGIKAECHK